MTTVRTMESLSKAELINLIQNQWRNLLPQMHPCICGGCGNAKDPLALHALVFVCDSCIERANGESKDE